MEDQAEPSRPLEMWAIVELMGHQKIAGKVTEQTIGGGAMIRVDVPATAARAPFTKFYGNAAIYCITPVCEHLACRAAEGMQPEALREWELPWLPGPDHGEDDE